MALANVYETPLWEIIRTMLDVTHRDWVEGTATGGTTATIIDTARDEADNYFENTSPQSRAHILSTTDGAAPVGQDRKITTSTCTTNGTMTVTQLFAPAPGAGDTYGVYSVARWTSLVRYVNTAINQYKTRFPIRHIDETGIILQTSQYEYPIPEAFSHICKITQADSSGYFKDSIIPPDHYTVVYDTIPRLRFYQYPAEFQLPGIYFGELWFNSSMSDGRYLRIEGLQLQPTLTDDNDLCYLHPDMIAFHAGGLLHLALSTRSDVDPDYHKNQADNWLARAEDIAKKVPFQLPPDTKKVKT